MFQSYSIYESFKVEAIERFAKEMKPHLAYKGISLVPAFKREIWTIISRLDSDYSNQSEDVLKRMINESIVGGTWRGRFISTWKSRIRYILGIGDRLFDRWPVNRSTLVVATRKKHANYIKLASTDDEFPLIWLLLPGISRQDLGLNSQDRSVYAKLPYSSVDNRCIVSKLAYYFEMLIETTRSLNLEKVLVCEGDASYHSLLALACRQLSIKVHCYQWGGFHMNKLRVCFSDMIFDKFFTWGPYFNALLKEYNPDTSFSCLGRLDPVQLVACEGYLLFIDPGGFGQYVSPSDYRDLLDLAIKLARKGFARVVWRFHPSSKIQKSIVNQLLSANISIDDALCDISASIKKSAFCISMYSTSLIDVLFYKRIALQLVPRSGAKVPFPMEEYGIGATFYTAKEGLNIIEELYKCPERRAAYCDRLEKYYSLFFSSCHNSKPIRPCKN